LKELAQKSYTIEWLPVANDGSISVASMVQQTRPETRLITVMLVNHETGAIHRLAVDWRKQYLVQWSDPTSIELPLFHCDAAQAVGKLPVDFRQLDVDALTFSAHKFHGPKGIGALLLKRCTLLRPLLFGGHQQKGKRPGTEAVPLAVGMAKALHLAHERMAWASQKVQALRDRLIQQLQHHSVPMVINSPQQGSPYVLNVSFPGCRAEMLLIKLDLLGVACSTGSACSSGSMLPSPVLQAMHVSDAVLHSAMRFSFDPSLTEEQIDDAAQRIHKAVRMMQESAVA
jgi:cysteine desulfurase